MTKFPKEYEEIYKVFYINYLEATTFLRILGLGFEKWSQLKAYNSYKNIESILEIGAGNLNHLKFKFKK